MALLRGAVLLLAVVLAVQGARLRRDDDDDEKYTQRFDNVDLDEVLASDRLLRNYYNCIMDLGRCTPDAMELKSVLPEALANNCKKCSDKQRAGAEKVLVFLLKNRKDEWAALEKRYDPTGKYRKVYEAEAQKRGITLPPKA